MNTEATKKEPDSKPNPEYNLWETSHDAIEIIVQRLERITHWNTQLLYIGTQINNLGIVHAGLAPNVAGVRSGVALPTRIIIEITRRIMIGVKNPDFCERQLKLCQTPPDQRRTETEEDEKLFKETSFPNWPISNEEQKGVALCWNIGNKLIHAYPDAGPLLRGSSNNHIHIKASAICIEIIVGILAKMWENTENMFSHDLLTGIKNRFSVNWEILGKCPKKPNECFAFEERISEELRKRGVKVS